MRYRERSQTTILASIFLVCLALGAFAPTISLQWIWDDDYYVHQNPELRDGGGLARIWLDNKSTPQYYPMVFSTFWLEYQLWGLWPPAFHFTNILLHAANSCLLYQLLRRLNVPVAIMAAALFAVHPVHVESVAWITERKNTLSGLFYLVSFHFMWSMQKDTRDNLFWFALNRNWWLAFLCFLFALLSKSITASLPAAFLVVAWGTHSKIDRRLILSVIPFFAVGIMAGLHTAYLEKFHVGATGDDWNLSIADRLALSGKIAWFYAFKLCYPSPLIFFYPQLDTRADQFTDFLPSIFAILLLVLSAVYQRRLTRLPIAAMLFFGGTLVPVLGFFDVYPFRFSVVADHFQYLASIGVFVLVPSLVLTASERLVHWQDTIGLIVGKEKTKSRSNVPRPTNQLTLFLLYRLIPAVAILALIVVTWIRIPAYYNAGTLWKDTVHQNPDSSAAHNNLGRWYFAENELEKARHHFEIALGLGQDRADVLCNLGILYAKEGDNNAARTCFRDARRISPNHELSAINLGDFEFQRNNLQASIDVFEEFSRIRKTFEVEFRLGLVLYHANRLHEALEHFREARKLRPTDVDVAVNIANLERELRSNSRLPSQK